MAASIRVGRDERSHFCETLRPLRSRCAAAWNCFRQVLGTVQREIDAIVEISLGEEKIRTAPEHPFYINGQWKAAGELEVGEMVTTMVQEQVISGQAWEEKKPIEIKENSILVEGVTYHTDKKEKVYKLK